MKMASGREIGAGRWIHTFNLKISVEGACVTFSFFLPLVLRSQETYTNL